MSSTWFLLFVGVITVGSVLVGVVRNRRFRRVEDLHRKLAQQFGLQIAYLNQRDYRLYGQHRGYPLRIEAAPLKIPKLPKPPVVVSLSLPMINPNLKCLRISRTAEPSQPLDEYGLLDRPQVLGHQIAPWLDIHTNDLMFAGIILSEDVKISLFDVFNRVERGLLLLRDEEMTFYLPDLLETEEVVALYGRIVALLCDMKDELQ